MTTEKITYQLLSTAESENEFFDAMPKLMFKYRVWANKYHQAILKNCELYMSSPIQFNDPYDCGLPFYQDPTDWDAARIKSKVEQTALRVFQHLRDDPKRLEEECARQVMLILQNPKEWFQTNYGYRSEDLSQMFGIVSLTPHPNNFLMWSHYADSHSGFCIGFDTQKLVKHNFGQFGAVKYSEQIPMISILDNDLGLMSKLIYTKSIIWKYEDEYRITGVLKPNRTVDFNPDAISRIYFGNRMEHRVKMEIIEFVKSADHLKHIAIHEMNLGQKCFELVENRVY